MVNGFVHIIESPSSQDILDGRTEGRALCEALRLSGIQGCYSAAVSWDMFLEALYNRLSNAIGAFPGKQPILHISAHGNADGIGLTNGEYVGWNTLRSALAPLNNGMNGGLLICMSSCFGGSGCRMAMHEENEQPFWALVGHTSDANWADAAVGYTAFYHRFFKGAPLKDCVKAMQYASGDENFDYWNGHSVKARWAEQMSQERRAALARALASASRQGGSNQSQESDDNGRANTEPSPQMDAHPNSIADIISRGPPPNIWGS